MQFLITPGSLKRMDAPAQREVMRSVFARSRWMRLLRIMQYPVRTAMYVIVLLALNQTLHLIGWYTSLAVLLMAMMVIEETVSRWFFLRAVDEEMERRVAEVRTAREEQETPEGEEETNKKPDECPATPDLRDVSYWAARAAAAGVLSMEETRTNFTGDDFQSIVSGREP